MVLERGLGTNCTHAALDAVVPRRVVALLLKRARAVVLVVLARDEAATLPDDLSRAAILLNVCSLPLT
eukprot:m.362578 g.362578  ORF g.362578 m.362578 type:complete len:68 (-) comp20664_c0_seq1:318-521(-)